MRRSPPGATIRGRTRVCLCFQRCCGGRHWRYWSFWACDALRAYSPSKETNRMGLSSSRSWLELTWSIIINLINFISSDRFCRKKLTKNAVFHKLRLILIKFWYILFCLAFIKQLKSIFYTISITTFFND